MIMNSSTILISFSTTGKDISPTSTPLQPTNSTTAEANGPPHSAEMIVLYIMLIVFFILGVVGNAMAFYIYYQKRDKTTSTLFILSLAATDFITCLVAIPYTLIVEMLHYSLVYDIACKAYLFVITFNVPLSAFIMVAVGFDRYFCICHPFLHAMTVWRAKVCLVCLTLFSCGCGIMTSLGFGVYYVNDTVTDSLSPEPSPLPASPLSSCTVCGAAGTTIATTIFGNGLSNGAYSVVNGTSLSSAAGYNSASGTIQDAASDRNAAPSSTTRGAWNDTGLWQYGEQTSESSESVSDIIYYGSCVTNTIIFSKNINDIYQKVYAALFLLSFLVIAVLYALIYRSILIRRAWKAKRKRMSCYSSTANGPEPTAVVAEETQLTNINGNNAVKTIEGGRGGGGSKNPTSRSTSVALRDRMLYANIKTAAMLFVVTIVFIISFLPSWLIGLGVFGMNYILFYIYFFNNVANPFIYAFMNRTFRDDLRQLCKRIRLRLSQW